MYSPCIIPPFEKNIRTDIIETMLLNVLVSVSKFIGYGQEDRHSISGKGWDFFHSPPNAPDACPCVYLMDTPGALYPRINWLDRETYRCSIRGIEIKNAWSSNSIAPLASRRGNNFTIIVGLYREGYKLRIWRVKVNVFLCLINDVPRHENVRGECRYRFTHS
jgi:hypothetical protein